LSIEATLGRSHPEAGGGDLQVERIIRVEGSQDGVGRLLGEDGLGERLGLPGAYRLAVHDAPKLVRCLGPELALAEDDPDVAGAAVIVLEPDRLDGCPQHSGLDLHRALARLGDLDRLGFLSGGPDLVDPPPGADLDLLLDALEGGGLPRQVQAQEVVQVDDGRALLLDLARDEGAHQGAPTRRAQDQPILYCL
jgi:hypothetical protein